MSNLALSHTVLSSSPKPAIRRSLIIVVIDRNRCSAYCADIADGGPAEMFSRLLSGVGFDEIAIFLGERVGFMLIVDARVGGRVSRAGSKVKHEAGEGGMSRRRT